MNKLRIDILTFQDCPNAAKTLERVRQAIEAERIAAEIREIEVDSVERAVETRFLGSPSVRINGEDIEAGAEDRTEHGLMCRTYRSGESTTGEPPVAMIRDAIRAHLSKPPH